MTLATPLIFLALACVPKKDLLAVQADLASAKQTMSAQIEQQGAQITSLEQALADEKARSADLDSQIAAKEVELATSQSQVDALTKEKAELVNDRSRLKSSIAETQQALKELSARKAQADARIAQYKDLLSRFQTLIDAGKLKVRITDGRMVVELATDVLFASGKADLSEGGKAAVAEVGGVLASIPERRFQVEGHTDNVPIKSAAFPSNWELASARAITVVRALVEAGVLPDKVNAAAYGEFRPVAANDSAEGKASNRRIEITVVPDLSQLPGFEELSNLGGR